MQLVCQTLKCNDYSTDDGDPAWCNRAGCPAMVAVNKCPKRLGKQNGGSVCRSEDQTMKSEKKTV
jgi:hypothetical protein